MATPSHKSPPTESASLSVTRLLAEWRRGDEEAGHRLLESVYAELRRLAVRAMRRESTAHTLQPTALVHEAYLRLVDQNVEWRNRAHFFGIAAQVMRRILVDHARARLSGKRGGQAQRVTLEDAYIGVGTASPGAIDVLALNEALSALAKLDAQQAKLVEMRYFAGLSIAETAQALGVSPATVKREWAVARAWLRRELSDA